MSLCLDFVCRPIRYGDWFSLVSNPESIAKRSCYRAMLCIRGNSHGPVSVRLSVTSRSSTKTAKRRITQTTPHDSPGTHSFLKPKISAKPKICTKARVLEQSAITTDQLLCCRYLARYSHAFCWHAYSLLSTSLVVLSNQALLLAGQQLTPSSLCLSCQSYIVNLTGH